MATCSPVGRKLGPPESDDNAVGQVKRRHKRKSTEPKRIGEVLQMKRFRWDSDDSSNDSAERPSSSDSGCHTADSFLRQSVIQSIGAKCGEDDDAEDGQPRPRNYKSMNRQRRIEANARERSRVHTISAAFESLRRAVPAYADNQKLSKLAILRIASSYILSLACLNDLDYSMEQKKPNFSECVALCTNTIQAEGRSRRRSKD